MPNHIFKSDDNVRVTFSLDGDEYQIEHVVLSHMESLGFHGWSYKSMIEERGYSNTYLVTLHFGKEYVLKFIKASAAPSKESMLNEISIQDKASHLDIAPKIMFAFTFELGSVILMEYVGITLEKYLVDNVDHLKYMTIFIEVLAIVNKMHDNFIYHCDLHFGNLTFNTKGDGKIYIIDFGLSVAKEQVDHTLMCDDYDALVDGGEYLYSKYEYPEFIMLQDIISQYFNRRFTQTFDTLSYRV